MVVMVSGMFETGIIDHPTNIESHFAESQILGLARTYPLNERQRLVLNKVLDGLNSKLKTSKWASIAKSSPDTALRDIKDLMEKGILRQEAGGGRSTHYELVFDETIE